MNLIQKLFLNCAIGTVVGFASGCASTNGDSSFQKWADSASCSHRFVIVSQHLSKAKVQEIANKYGAPTFYKPSNGFLVDAMAGGLSHTAGAADPKSWGLVRSLVKKLEIINATKKHWDIFVMEDASYLFAQTLKAMPDNDLSAANGVIHLVGWKKTIEVEDAIYRISNGKFIVVYE